MESRNGANQGIAASPAPPHASRHVTGGQGPTRRVSRQLQTGRLGARLKKRCSHCKRSPMMRPRLPSPFALRGLCGIVVSAGSLAFVPVHRGGRSHESHSSLPAPPVSSGSEASLHFHELAGKSVAWTTTCAAVSSAPRLRLAGWATVSSDLASYRHFDIDIRDDGAGRAVCQAGRRSWLVIHTAAQPSHDWAAREPRTDSRSTLSAPSTARGDSPYCRRHVHLHVHQQGLRRHAEPASAVVEEDPLGDTARSAPLRRRDRRAT